MKFREFLLLKESASVQSLINLNFPRIIAQDIFKKIGPRYAYTVARWYKEYNASILPSYIKKEKWFYYAEFGSKLPKNIKWDLYFASKKGNWEKYNNLRKEWELGKSEYAEWDMEEISEEWEKGLKKEFWQEYFFRTSIMEDFLAGKITNLNKYSDLSYAEATEKYEKDRMVQNYPIMASYENGWAWLNAGKYCSYTARKMRNCGRVSALSFDEDAHMVLLRDEHLNPHVVMVYSPRLGKVTNIEGAASTAPKKEYYSYIWDFLDKHEAEWDTRVPRNYPKYYEMLLNYLLRKSEPKIEVICDENSYIPLFSVKMNGRKYYSQGTMLLSHEDFLLLRNDPRWKNDDKETKLKRIWTKKDSLEEDYPIKFIRL